MSTPKPKAPRGSGGKPIAAAAKPSTAKPTPTPMVHGGRPAGGKHVESCVPGAGPYDFSGAVGSNITSAPGPTRETPGEVLNALPWSATYPTAGMADPPMF